MPRIRWTDEQESSLRKWAIEGYSASEIKEKMENVVSRSAVLAKAYHLGIRLYGNIRFFKKKGRK